MKAIQAPWGDMKAGRKGTRLTPLLCTLRHHRCPTDRRPYLKERTKGQAPGSVVQGEGTTEQEP